MTARVISLLSRKAPAEGPEQDCGGPPPRRPGEVVTPHGRGVWLHMPAEPAVAEVEAGADEHGPAAAAGGRR